LVKFRAIIWQTDLFCQYNIYIVINLCQFLNLRFVLIYHFFGLTNLRKNLWQSYFLCQKCLILRILWQFLRQKCPNFVVNKITFLVISKQTQQMFWFIFCRFCLKCYNSLEHTHLEVLSDLTKIFVEFWLFHVRQNLL